MIADNRRDTERAKRNVKRTRPGSPAIFRHVGSGRSRFRERRRISRRRNAFEASIVDGVENAKDPDVSEVTTRQVPEGYVPEEYRTATGALRNSIASEIKAICRPNRGNRMSKTWEHSSAPHIIMSGRATNSKRRRNTTRPRSAKATHHAYLANEYASKQFFTSCGRKTKCREAYGRAFPGSELTL